ncbi:MAG: hypothetical protein WAT39_11200, partial [Planctomycetota bacterium]
QRRATGRISIVGTTFHAPATHSSRITWERPTAPNQQLSKKSQMRSADEERLRGIAGGLDRDDRW